jgi:hypothetical protein
MAFVLCACASTAPGDLTPSVQNAVYVIGEGMPQSQAVAAVDAQRPADGMQPSSKLMRLYWFFAGR